MRTADEVGLTLPPTSAHLRIARLTAVSVAEDAGLSYEEVDDLRIALDELCLALVEVDDVDTPISLTFQRSDGRVRVDGRRRVAGHGSPQLSELTRRILAAAVDRYELRDVDSSRDGQLRTRAFTIVKSAARAGGGPRT